MTPTDAQQEEIERCPFCGVEAEIIGCSVHCNNPCCEAQPFTAGQSEAEAIAAWNRRASPDTDAAHEYLRDALKLPDTAPRRFDYYAHVIEADADLMRQAAEALEMGRIAQKRLMEVYAGYPFRYVYEEHDLTQIEAVVAALRQRIGRTQVIK